MNKTPSLLWMGALGLALSPLALAVDLEFRPGEWEVNVNMGPPRTLPADVLARMAPSERTKMEAALRSSATLTGKGHKYRRCATRETMLSAFSPEDAAGAHCTQSLTEESPKNLVIHYICPAGSASGTGDVRLEVIDPEHLKGGVTAEVASPDGKDPTKLNGFVTAKWLAESCDRPGAARGDARGKTR